jgi:hypothetical protein
MSKSKHREAQRVLLPNGLWVTMFADGDIKVSGYDCRLEVIEVLNRSTGGSVFFRYEQRPGQRQPKRRRGDLITVEQ